jgi:hypothetical protein
MFMGIREKDQMGKGGDGENLWASGKALLFTGLSLLEEQRPLP